MILLHKTVIDTNRFDLYIEACDNHGHWTPRTGQAVESLEDIDTITNRLNRELKQAWEMRK